MIKIVEFRLNSSSRHYASHLQINADTSRYKQIQVQETEGLACSLPFITFAPLNNCP